MTATEITPTEPNPTQTFYFVAYISEDANFWSFGIPSTTEYQAMQFLNYDTRKKREVKMFRFTLKNPML